MKARNSIISMMAVLSLTTANAQIKPMDEFIDDLMAKMTVDEKIGQLNLISAGLIVTGITEDIPAQEYVASGKAGAILNTKGVDNILAMQKAAVENSRLGIPLLVGLDVIHGYETIFPLPIGMACTWDIPAVERSARVAAVEASADGICWTYSPMVDIALDARWGRISEGNGEDPYLGSLIAAAMVRGYQGDLTQPDQIMACLKHFALYGAAEAGRDYNTVDMSHIRMYNQYFPPYKAAVEAGVGSVMTSFNVVDYVPATANRWLLEDVLRKQWGFDGFIVTDHSALKELVNHGMGDIQETAARALKAGTDLDMCSMSYFDSLKKSLDEGLVSMEEIDKACRRVLEAKYKLGLFTDPYRYCNKEKGQKVIYCDEHRAIAREITAESFVLLKNEGNILPLKKEGKIALIGPLADSKYNTVGTWAMPSGYDKYSTLRESLEKTLAGKAELLYAQGSNVYYDEQLQNNGAFYRIIPRVDDVTAREEALRIAAQADVILCAMGEEEEMAGECSSRSDLEMPDAQRDLLKELVKLGKPIVLLSYAGRPTVLTWESEHIPAIMSVWFGSEYADALCDVLFGDKVPSGKLVTSMPRTTGQEPLYYNHLPTGRPVAEGAESFQKFTSAYLDVSNDPLYPFGYGLSYTSFSYGDLTLDKTEMAKDGSVKASIKVTNTGNYDADEVVQLYIHDVAASISRPVKELKGFERIHLAKGESKEVTFTITPDLLKFYDAELNFVLEPGLFEVMAGPDSADASLKKASFTVK